MRVIVALAVVTLISSVPHWAMGNQNLAPPVTPETINGLWEALSEDDMHVFRLELADGAGWLAVGISFIEPMIFALTETQWQKNGVELRFRGVGSSSRGAGGSDDPTPYTAVLHLRGVAWRAPEFGQGGGLLTGEFVLSPERPNPSRWKLRFLKQTISPYLDTICKLSVQAKEAIEQQKKAAK